jgi:hypothetical protein
VAENRCVNMSQESKRNIDQRVEQKQRERERVTDELPFLDFDKFSDSGKVSEPIHKNMLN